MIRHTSNRHIKASGQLWNSRYGSDDPPANGGAVGLAVGSATTPATGPSAIRMRIADDPDGTSNTIFLGEKQKQAGAKAALVAFLLYFMNAVVTHATARAHFVREKGTWPPPEPMEVVKED